MYGRLKAHVLSTYRASATGVHRKHRARALRFLKNIESQSGPLDEKDRALCDEYAHDVLGSRMYAPWLYVYSAVSGEFKEGWIPENFYQWVVVPRIKGDYGILSRLNSLNTTFFGHEYFPDLAAYVNGFFIGPRGDAVQEAEIKDILFASGDKVVFKLDQSAMGKGIHFFEKERFRIEDVKALGNGVFQSFIDQDNALAEFMPSAVSTLRVTTVSEDDGTASVRSCHLRLGVGDDTYCRADRNIRIAVDVKDGRLGALGYGPSWTVTSSHPDSEKPYEGAVYPNFDEVCRVVRQLQRMVPYVRCIGWDICVDRSGRVRIMEWNGKNNLISFAEASQGPCFGDLNWDALARA